MVLNWNGRRRPVSLVWPAALLGAGGAAGLWLWLAQRDSVQVSLASGALALTVVLGIIWQSRARSARRFQAALDAYVARELGRAPRRKGFTRAKKILPRAPALQSHQASRTSH